MGRWHPHLGHRWLLLLRRWWMQLGDQASLAPGQPVELLRERWRLLLLHMHRLPPRHGHGCGHRWWRLLGLHGVHMDCLGEAVSPTHLVLDDGALGLLKELREDEVVLLPLLLFHLILHQGRRGGGADGAGPRQRGRSWAPK